MNMQDFLEFVCNESGYRFDSVRPLIGEGYSGNVWRISEDVCIKISESGRVPTFPDALRECRNLCIPFRTYVSASGMYRADVQPFLNGLCIQEYIIRKEKLSEEDTACIIYDVLQGLAKLHGQGYVHRDFYPGNIIQNFRDGETISAVIDFDEMQKQSEDTRPCFRFSGYHAPEIVLHDESYDEKSEMFSLGVIMWELLFGSCPFGGYDYFGRVIAESWAKYEKNAEDCHAEVREGIKRLKKSLEEIDGVSGECAELLQLLLAEKKEARITSSVALQHNFFKMHRKKQIGEA